AGTPGRGLGPALDENFLREIGAAEADAIVVIIVDAEFAVIAAARIAPLIRHARAPRIEAVIIGVVGVAAVLAVHVLGQRRAQRAAHHHARDGRAAAPAALAQGIAQQAADQRTGNDAAGIDLGAAFAVIAVVLIGVLALILLLPALAGIALHARIVIGARKILARQILRRPATRRRAIVIFALHAKIFPAP